MLRAIKEIYKFSNAILDSATRENGIISVVCFLRDALRLYQSVAHKNNDVDSEPANTVRPLPR